MSTPKKPASGKSKPIQVDANTPPIPRKTQPKARKQSPPKPVEAPESAANAPEHLTPDQITYPSGELVVDANGDKHELPTDGDLNTNRAVSRFERQQTAIMLRIGGATYQQIASRLDISRETVKDYLTDGMKELNTESSQMLRNVYGSRLEMLLQRYWTAALQNDVGALSAVLSIMDRQFRLYGMDTPEPAEVVDSASDIVVLSKTSTKEEFIVAMQRARKQIEGKQQ